MSKNIQPAVTTHASPAALYQSNTHLLPDTGFVRLWQIVGSKKKNIPPLIPVSRTTYLNGVKSGKYPQPVRSLGVRTIAWRVQDIRELIEKLGA